MADYSGSSLSLFRPVRFMKNSAYSVLSASPTDDLSWCSNFCKKTMPSLEVKMHDSELESSLPPRKKNNDTYNLKERFLNCQNPPAPQPLRLHFWQPPMESTVGKVKRNDFKGGRKQLVGRLKLGDAGLSLSVQKISKNQGPCRNMNRDLKSRSSISSSVSCI